MKISVITPAFKSCDTLQRAIESVLAQDYPHYEHVVVDGGSTDGSVELLGRYPHLRWISEPDKGQVDAMRKGFALSSGEIIGNLNADDWYLPGAFSTAAREFKRGADFVVGNVEVRSEHDQSMWLNEPEVSLSAMLRHWLPSAFCVNPVGYFYRRQVQDAMPFNTENDDKHDLEFLLRAAARFDFRKVDATFGVFEHVIEAKTFRNQMRPSYWNVENFSFVEEILSEMEPEFQKRFRVERERGYQLRRNWTTQAAARLGFAARLYQDGEILLIPGESPIFSAHGDGFVPFVRPASRGDSILVVLGPPGGFVDAVRDTLRSVATEELPFPVYRVHEMDTEVADDLPPSKLLQDASASTGRALRYLASDPLGSFKWTLLVGIDDPIAVGLATALGSGAFREGKDIGAATLRIARRYVRGFARINGFDFLDMDPFGLRFDPRAGWVMYERGQARLLVYRCQDIRRVFGEALDALLALPHLRLDESRLDSWDGRGRDGSDWRGLVDASALAEIYYAAPVRHFYSDAEIDAFRQRWT